MSERQRAFVLTQIEHLTEDDIAKIVYVKGCTELEGHSAIKLFQALEKKQRFSNYLETMASLFEEIGRKDLAYNVSMFNLKQSGANAIKRVQSEKSCSQLSPKIHDPLRSLPTRIAQPTSEDEAEMSQMKVLEYLKREPAHADDDDKQPHLAASNRVSPLSGTGGLSVIESDGTGEQLESLGTSRHSPPAELEDDACTASACAMKPRNDDPSFSCDFKWKIRRSAINDAIYHHKKGVYFQSPNPLLVPIYKGRRNTVKISFILYHNGLDKGRDANTILDARLMLPNSFRGQSAAGIHLKLTVGAYDDGDKLLKLLKTEISLNTQIVSWRDFISHQQLKTSESGYIFIRAGYATCTACPYRLVDEVLDGSNDTEPFLMIEKDDHE